MGSSRDEGVRRGKGEETAKSSEGGEMAESKVKGRARQAAKSKIEMIESKEMAKRRIKTAKTRLRWSNSQGWGSR